MRDLWRGISQDPHATTGAGADLPMMHRHGITPDLTTPSGSMFLARSCEVLWDTASRDWHLGFVAHDWQLAHMDAPTSLDLPPDLPYTTEPGPFVEDSDRTPYPEPNRSGVVVPLVVAGVVAAVVLVAAIRGSE